MIVNEVADEKKVPALLSLIGPTTYQILRDLTAPDLPKDKTFDQLCTKLSTHFNPKPLVIAERFRFHKRDQKPDESINDYNVSLRKLSEHCKFGTNLNDTLRDRFVCGLKSETMQKKLLTEVDLTYENAVKIAVSMESASKDVQELHGKSEHVHKLKSQKFKQPKPPQKKPQQKLKQKEPQNSSKSKCTHCNRTNHASKDCRFKDATCYQCKNKGHIVPACTRNRESVHQFVETEDDEACLFSVKTETKGKGSRSAIWVNPKVNGRSLKMELDTGAAVSVISKTDFERMYPRKNLLPTSLTLKTYSGEVIEPCGLMKCKVELNGQTKVLDLYVVNNDNKPLFGREWLKVLKLNWTSIKTLGIQEAEEKVKELKKKYKNVFSKELGTMKDIKAHLTLKENASPKFVKSRSVAFALKPKIEEELDKMVEEGILEKVNHSNWATPIVPVPKKNGLRICGDFKVTVNPQLQIDHHPLPKIEDIFASLGKGKKFTKIDLKNAYLQMEVDEESQELLTISTHKGLYRYNRLMFGIASAPAIFQRTIEQIMADVPGINIILDDMIITGDTDEEHLKNIEHALQKLDEHNLRVNPDKCEFFKEEVEFCGHIVDKDGLHKTEEKIRAIVDCPEITNVQELRSFLGLVQYYARFMPNLSAVVYPLNQLLKKNAKWQWSDECENALQTVKSMITSDLVLMNYDPALPLVLACDASSRGLGAVISHTLPDKTERPIAFASRSLNDAEKNYSQIDKEALALVWGVKKFSSYLYGNKFTLITDHKPLLSIFGPKKGLSATTGARLQRYSLFLAGYDYDIRYKSTTAHGNCDSLSRLPLVETEINSLDVTDEFLNSMMENLPVTCTQIANNTRKDRVLSQVFEYVSEGWSEMEQCDMNNELKPFFNKRVELSLHQGCIMWGARVVIPDNLKKVVLKELHEGHVGVVKMKALARSYLWWPTIDIDIENMAKSCSGCTANKVNPPEAPIHPWEFPTKPWSRVHIDFAGPFMGYMYLVLVDAYSKWPIVKVMKNTTATQTVEVVRAVFADCGVCDEIVSDNGPQFVSEEFSHFLRMNGVRHIRSSPYHPRTNGLAERFVQTFKQAMKAAKNDSGTIQTKVSKFLLQYRNAEHATTKESPAKLFLRRSLSTRLDRMKPSLQDRVRREQSKMVRSVRNREFSVGESVAVRDYRKGQDKWISGVIQQKTGPVSYSVQIEPGVHWRRHADQIRVSAENTPRSSGSVLENVTPPTLENALGDVTPPSLVNIPDSTSLVPRKTASVEDSTVGAKRSTATPAKPPDKLPERRYPERIRKKPEKLDL